MSMADALLAVAMAHSMNRERKMNRMDGDTIYRQAAIDALDGEFDITGRKNAETIRDYINGVNKKLRELPSAERRGRWIENEFGAYCSECGLYAYRSNGIPWKSNYCPICGASMMDDNAIQHTKCVGNALDALDEVEE